MQPEFGVGSDLNPATRTNANHAFWLAKEEQERKHAEVSRHMNLMSSPPPGNDLAALLDLLKSPQAVTKRLAQLVEQTTKAEAATAAARQEQEKARRAMADLAGNEAASTAKIERQEAEHAAWLLKERSEIEHEKANLAQLRAAVEADAAKAKELLTVHERKQRAYDAA
jgi:hypothetical protein